MNACHGRQQKTSYFLLVKEYLNLEHGNPVSVHLCLDECGDKIYGLTSGFAACSQENHVINL
jgi:hypothetical protein